MNISVSLAVTGIIFIGSSESDTSCKLLGADEYKVMETANWDENNESKECAGILDIMLISSNFLQGDEGSESVFPFAPGEGSWALSIFEDKYCEELAYPGIYCGERRVENSEREVPGYYSDVYVNQNLDIVTKGLLPLANWIPSFLGIPRNS